MENYLLPLRPDVICIVFLNINSDAVVKHTARLERMGKTQLPVAVRSALNSAAFNVKKNTMPAQAKASFIQRKPTFFQANSKVTPAKGLAVKNMQAIVGFVPKSGTDKSVDDLEQQEHGGDIMGRSFIPLATARTGGSWNKNVKSNLRISDVKKKIVDASDAKGGNDKEKFIKSALHAGKGGFVIGTGTNSEGNRTLFHIRSIKRIGKSTVIKSIAVFSVKGGRKVNPGATHFMELASRKSATRMEEYFITAAKKMIR